VKRTAFIALCIVSLLTGIGLAFFASSLLDDDVEIEEAQEPEEEIGEEAEVEIVTLSVSEREEILNSDPAGEYPIRKKGIFSWQEVYILALDWPEYADALFYQGSISSWEELAYLAESGGYDSIVTIPKGTKIRNSYYKNSEIRFVVEVLERDRNALKNPYREGEKFAILVSCGNPIKVLPPEPKPEPTPKPEPPTVTPPSPPPPSPPPPTPRPCPPGDPSPDPPLPSPTPSPCPDSGGPSPDPPLPD